MNLECLVAHMTKFCVLVHTVFSIVEVFFFLCTKISISSHA